MDDSTHLLAFWCILCIFFCDFIKLSSSQVTSFSSIAAEDHSEAIALLKWKATFSNQSQANLFSWNGINPCKHWKGITCDGSMSVFMINLASLGLKGTLLNLNFSSLSKLHHMNLSKNNFEENIPSKLGQLQALQELDLSGNLLKGTIPSELGDLTSLITLNFSHNNLSGTIPSSFDHMNALISVDISYNQLEGSLPNNSAFRDIKFEALTNNKGLCGNVTGLNNLCNKVSSNSHGHKSKKVKLLVLFLTLGTLILVVVGVSYIFYRRVRKAKSQDEEAQTQNPYFVRRSHLEREILYEDFIVATRNFDERYVIGQGSQGSVYRAELPTGQVVAVKKLHSMPDGEISNLKAFTNEIQALVEIKHRNIVKLHGFCSKSQFSFLVYEFLEGGSLHDILKNKNKATKLDWNKRVNIVKCVANALFHMHHGCSVPIVHHNLSSKNVLLDFEYEARITDFGEAMFLTPGSSNMTSFVGTYGYAAPETAYTMKASEKLDIYSFGVLTLEIIMGEHPMELIASLLEAPTYNLLLENVLDWRLPRPTIPIVEEVMVIAKIAFACLNISPSFRPTMEQVCIQLMWPKSHLVDRFSTITLAQLMED